MWLNVEEHVICWMKAWIELFANGYLWWEVRMQLKCKFFFKSVWNNWLCSFRQLDYALETVIQHLLQEDQWFSETVNTWNGGTMERDQFAHTFSNYDLQNIYNADEFGLFYQMYPVLTSKKGKMYWWQTN